MIVLRIARGIHEHFPARRSEWVLAGIMIVWGAILSLPTSAFQNSPSWREMAAIMSEDNWARLAMALGTFRLVALIVNGTFSNTWYGRYSPHVRSLASLLACFLWAQISYGLWSTGLISTGLAVYPGLLVLDIFNVISATKDAGELDKAKAYERA